MASLWVAGAEAWFGGDNADRMDLLPEREWVGNCDLPSIWNQGLRKGMSLHWDGNNNSVEERNRSAAFGTGAIPPTLDRPSGKRMETWLADAKPPARRVHCALPCAPPN